MAKLRRVEKRGRTEWVLPEDTHFITVDLDVYSRVRLKGLVEAFGDKMLVLYEGRCGSRYLASFELSRSWQLSADQEIRRLVAFVQALPRPARRLWDGAQSRVFDIGLQAGLSPRMHALPLSQGTIAGVASVGGRITVTTYAPQDERADAKAPVKRRRPTRG